LFEKIKVFFKNQKHEPNIVEITHLCIMHGAHTSLVKWKDYHARKTSWVNESHKDHANKTIEASNQPKQKTLSCDENITFFSNKGKN
jgi:hypothetical protein